MKSIHSNPSSGRTGERGAASTRANETMLQRIAPALVLFLLAPLIAEVLFGATPITRIGALIPVVPLYGGGALLIRELARRRGGGWARIALLGAAYAIVEEETISNRGRRLGGQCWRNVCAGHCRIPALEG
jgi:hypothetical protein